MADDALQFIAVELLQQPEVMATEAFLGSRPVAKAFSAGSSMM